MKQLILASASPRRKQLLEILGLKFSVHPSKIEENLISGLTPQEQVEALSRQKAEIVGKKFENVIIIAADTMVIVGRETIGKPKNIQDAKVILKKLSGTQHLIVTSFTILDTQTKKSITKTTETKVWFRKISEYEIDAYIAKAKPFDKAGGYAIHQLAGVFIEKIEGDCNGATGLSIFLLSEELKNFGIEVL